MIYPKEETTSSGGKGGDRRQRRRSFRHRENSGHDKKESQKPQQEKKQVQLQERPKWTPPKIPSDPLPSPPCPICGKTIRDIATAIAEKETGRAVHFDCIIARITQEEKLEKGDSVSYLGGGRFGIVYFNNAGESKKFTIKKVLEWENKEIRADWRSAVSDHYSVT